MSTELNSNCDITHSHKHSSGKIIDIYDNVFSFAEMDRFQEYINNANFRIDGADNEAIPLEMQTYSKFTHDDCNAMEFYQTNAYKKLNDKYEFYNMNCKQIRVNLTTPAEKNRLHVDALTGGLTLMYYANKKWELDWGGHTLFMNDVMGDAEFTCICKPNRLIVFDGTIPHMIMTPSNLCPTYRTTFVIQYVVKK